MQNRTLTQSISVVHGVNSELDFNMKPPDEEKESSLRNRKKSRASHLKRQILQILSNSMLTGIPQIMNADSIFRKVVKTLVFVFCLVGFFYQLWEFMEIYRKYHTVVDLQLKYPEHVELPSITVCNNNAIQKETFCRENPTLCEVKEGFIYSCWKNRYFCFGMEGTDQFNTSTARKIPNKSALKMEYTLTREELRRYALPQVDFIQKYFNVFVHKKVVGEYNESDIFDVSYVEDEIGRRRLCYTMFSAVQRGRPVIVSVTDGYSFLNSFIYSLISLNLNFYKTELVAEERVVGAQFQVHSPFTYVNPYITGNEIGVSRLALLLVTVSERNLLPPPYDTKCTNYSKLWEERNNFGPLSREMCMEECLLNLTMDACKCVKFSNLFPNDHRICTTEKEIACSESVSGSDCSQRCQPACHSVEYDVLLGESRKARKAHDFQNDYLIDIYGLTTTLMLYIRRPEVMVYTYNAKYETVTAFGYLGGYVGIWLGISFIALLDFGESVILLLKSLVYSLFRYQKNALRKMRRMAAHHEH